MKYARIFKTKKQALSFGKKALKKMSSVSGVRGGRIPSKKARLFAIKAIKGYSVGAKRK